MSIRRDNAGDNDADDEGNDDEMVDFTHSLSWRISRIVSNTRVYF